MKTPTYLYRYVGLISLLLGGFFISTPVFAATIRANPVSDTAISVSAGTGLLQGVGYGTWFSSSTPIGGLQLWVTNKAKTSNDNLHICLFAIGPAGGLTAEQRFQYFPNSAPQGKCVTQPFTSDANGLYTWNFSWPYSASSTMFYWIEEDFGGSETQFNSVVGSNYDYLSTLYINAATTTQNLFFTIFSGTAPTQFNANIFIPQTATSSVLSVCGSNFATTSGLIDSIGASFSYGLCVAGVYLFLPSQDSLNQFSNFTGVFQSRIPFSYFYDFYDTFNSLSASSTENLTAYTVQFPSLGSTTPIGDVVPTSIDILSTTTISKYYPDSLRETFLSLGSYAIWAGVLVVFYRRLVPNKVL